MPTVQTRGRFVVLFCVCVFAKRHDGRWFLTASFPVLPLSFDKEVSEPLQPAVVPMVDRIPMFQNRPRLADIRSLLREHLAMQQLERQDGCKPV